MSNLAERHQEFVNKLNELKTKRAEKIEAQVNEFRATLEAKPDEEIIKLEQLIVAINVIVAYEASNEPAVQETVEKIEETVEEKEVTEEMAEEKTEQETEEVSKTELEPEVTLARPGMTNVFINR